MSLFIIASINLFLILVFAIMLKSGALESLLSRIGNLRVKRYAKKLEKSQKTRDYHRES